MPLNKNNQVIIRVWTSEYNQTAPGENVGHISLAIGENEDTYVSFWPTAAGKANTKSPAPGFFKPIDSERKIDFQADLAAEERPPELTFALYSLNAVTMREKFDDETSKEPGWALIGSNMLLNQNSAHSCASMAYEVLKAGGIYDLLPSKFSSNLSSAPSPDALARAVIHAKKTELQEYPETQYFDGPECSKLPDDNPKTGLRCHIM